MKLITKRFDVAFQILLFVCFAFLILKRIPVAMDKTKTSEAITKSLITAFSEIIKFE